MGESTRNDVFGDKPVQYDLPAALGAAEAAAPEGGAAYAAALESLAVAAADADYAGLHDLCVVHAQALGQTRAPGSRPVDDAQIHQRVAWQREVRAYLARPDSRATRANLLAQLAQVAGPALLPEQDLIMFDAMLALAGPLTGALVAGNGSTPDPQDVPAALQTDDAEPTGTDGLHAKFDGLISEEELAAAIAASGDSSEPIEVDVFDQPISEAELSEASAGWLGMNDAEPDCVFDRPVSEKELAEASVGWPDASDAMQDDVFDQPISEMELAEASVGSYGDDAVVDDMSDDTIATLPTAAAGDGRAAEQTSVAVHAPDLPPALRELAQLLDAEIDGLERLAGRLAKRPFAAGDMETTRHDDLATLLERFGAAASSVGFQGLGDACDALKPSAMYWTTSGRMSGHEYGAFDRWCGAVRDYLGAPLSAAAVDAVANASCDLDLPVPGDAERRESLRAGLGHLDLSLVDDSGSARPTVAEAADVSLDIPEDADQELVDALLQELPAQADDLAAAIQTLEGAGAGENLRRAQRIAHTLKGAANTVGVRGIATLTHHMEDILQALNLEDRVPSAALQDVLLRTADCIGSMNEALLGRDAPPGDAQAVLQLLLDWANRADHDGVAALGEETMPTSPAVAADTGAHAATGADAGPVAVAAVEADAERAAEVIIRVPASLVDDLLKLVDEAIILTSHVQERARRSAAQMQTMQSQFALIQQLSASVERLVDVEQASVFRATARGVAGYDALEMDTYGELHTCSRQLIEAATDAREMGEGVASDLSELGELLVGQGRLNRDTQAAVLRTRMVPVSSVFARFQRGVRQTCRMTGKEAELHLHGGDVQVDSDVLESVLEPLMHLLRNAVDHGIEPAEQRARDGKPACGQISLSFSRDGRNLLVACSDDGHGLDWDAIRRGAERRGLVTDGQALDEVALGQLVLAPGFSTREGATQTSGRGIGMDVLNTRVSELGGTLEVQSRDGLGCEVRLRLPVTLISTHALLVKVAGQTLALADRGIERIAHPHDGQLLEQGGVQQYLRDGTPHPLVPMESLISLPAGARRPELALRPLIMARSASGVSAVPVDVVSGTRDVVVKGSGRYLPRQRGVLGATILGDGTVVPVLDLPELMRRGERADWAPQPDAEPAMAAPVALVVDDSLSARRAMARFVEDLGFEVHVARDGLEAVERLEAHWPDLLLADLEMPRMNGIELVKHVRSRERDTHLPSIMISSRSSAKHRDEAHAAGVDAYFGKPFSEDELASQVHLLLAAAGERSGTSDARAGGNRGT